MSNLEVICRLCDLLDRAQQIIRQQAELLSMHGVETDGKALERQRYWYGTCYDKCTTALLNSKTRQ